MKTCLSSLWKSVVLGIDSLLNGQFLRFVLFNPAFLVAVGVSLILLLKWHPVRPDPGLHLDRTARVRGWVSQTPEIRKELLYFEIRPLELWQGGMHFPYAGRIGVWLASSQANPQSCFSPPLRYGEILEFVSFLRGPSYYAVPGVPDQRHLAWLQGIPYRVQLKSPDQIKRLGQLRITTPLNPLFYYFENFENKCSQLLTSSSLRLLLSVFLGRKSSLQESEKARMRDLGILHLFVVSGFHVSLIVLVVHGALRFLGRTGPQLTVLAVWLYILTIGFPLPATRAGIIVTITYLLVMLGSKRSLLNSLGISAMVLLAVSPKNLHTASFQLSYSCICAIGLLASPCMRYVHAFRYGIEDFGSNRVLLDRNPAVMLRRRVCYFLEEKLNFIPARFIPLLGHWIAPTISYLATLCLFSVAIQLVLFPILIHYTNRWNWAQSLSNVVLMPIFSVLIGLCLLFFITFWTPVDVVVAAILGFWAEMTKSLIQSLAGLLDVTYLPQTRPWEITVYLLLMITASLALPRKLKLLALLIPALLICLLRQPSQPLTTGTLSITMLDVGQGECIHLRYPDGHDALIDTGGLTYPASGDFMGERVVARYLWHMRSPGLTYVLITHSDTDHRQGYRFLKKAFPISRLFYFEPHDDYAEPRIRLSARDSFSIAGVHHTVLHPPEKQAPQHSANDSSVVFTLRYGNFSMLFTGDISRKVEKVITPRVSRVTALKVPHHGSASSTGPEILRALQPKLALISAGRQNGLGHPATEVLERLGRLGCRVLSTSELGSIRLITDGFHWQVAHYSTKEGKFLHRLGPEACQAEP